MKYTTLLFDADGTLLDFDATEKRALQKVFDLHGICKSIRNYGLRMRTEGFPAIQ